MANRVPIMFALRISDSALAVAQVCQSDVSLSTWKAAYRLTLKALPPFMTTIDGLDIYFIHALNLCGHANSRMQLSRKVFRRRW